MTFTAQIRRLITLVLVVLVLATAGAVTATPAKASIQHHHLQFYTHETQYAPVYFSVQGTYNGQALNTCYILYPNRWQSTGWSVDDYTRITLTFDLYSTCGGQDSIKNVVPGPDGLTYFWWDLGSWP